MITNFQHQALARYHRAKMTTQDRLVEMHDDEQGELGSWLILAAGMAVAAGGAVTLLAPWFDTKVTDITGN